MKKLSIIILSVLFFVFGASAQARRKVDKDTEEWRYELEPVQTGSQGTYLIKVWSYSKKPNVAIEQAKKNAVHGIIFRGFSTKDRVEGKPSLTNNPNLEMEKQEFFTDFFADGGKYLKFVNITSDGSVAAEDLIKIGKEYKIGVIVSINVGALRKDLESAGIIKGLAAGF
jgi:hypothetical protein